MKLVLVSTILLLASKAFASSEVVQGGLRGGNEIEKSDLDRELQLQLSRGSSSTSLSFSVASASSVASSCFDPVHHCLVWGYDYLHADATTSAEAGGNSFAYVTSEVNLWLNGWCRAYADAYSLACTFTKVDGEIKVDTTFSGGSKEVSLSVALKTATKTLAIAQSKAIAASYVNAESQAFTSVPAFCTAVNNKSPLCAGTAATELTQVATAGAIAYGQAGALAKSGSVTKQNLSVSAKGSSLDFINGFISAYAKSWAFAGAGAAAATLSGAFVEVTNKSFAVVCAEQHGAICGADENKGEGVCGQTADIACAAASAAGSGYAAAAALAVAEAYVEAEAKAETRVVLSANLDCKGKPTLTWKSSTCDVTDICAPN